MSLESLYSDPDFGMVTGHAVISCYALSKRHTLSAATVWSHMHKNDIVRAGEQIGGKFNTIREQTYKNNMIGQINDLLRAWR